MKQEGKALGFTAFTSGWIGAGWVVLLLLYPATNRLSTVVGEMPR